MAQYLYVREQLDERVGPDKARGHFLFTTDPARGALRRIGEAEEIPMLPVPENVGGRFSVLSPVGLLPAAVCGGGPGRSPGRRRGDGGPLLERRAREESARAW